MHPVAQQIVAQCLRQLNFKNRLLPTGITISFIRSLGPSPRRIDNPVQAFSTKLSRD
jgi:hypothetical protein